MASGKEIKNVAGSRVQFDVEACQNCLDFARIAGFALAPHHLEREGLPSVKWPQAQVIGLETRDEYGLRIFNLFGADAVDVDPISCYEPAPFVAERGYVYQKIASFAYLQS